MYLKGSNEKEHDENFKTKKETAPKIRIKDNMRCFEIKKNYNINSEWERGIGNKLTAQSTVYTSAKFIDK